MPKKELPRKVIRQELMWPTPYWHTMIWHFMRSETRVTFNDDFTNYILNEKDNNKSVIKSNRGGWQSELVSSNNENYKPLIDEIVEFVNHLPISQKSKSFSIPQLWANVNTKGNWNTIHQHGTYHLSGTYYVKVPENCGRLCFRDPRPGAIGNLYLNKNFDEGEVRNVKLVEGLLMVWPNYLDHFVEPSQTDEERISISFDIVYNT